MFSQLRAELRLIQIFPAHGIISLRQGYGQTSRRVNRALRGRGWKVIRVWQHELARNNLPRLLRRLASIQD